MQMGILQTFTLLLVFLHCVTPLKVIDISDGNTFKVGTDENYPQFNGSIATIIPNGFYTYSALWYEERIKLGDYFKFEYSGRIGDCTLYHSTPNNYGDGFAVALNGGGSDYLGGRLGYYTQDTTIPGIAYGHWFWAYCATPSYPIQRDTFDSWNVLGTVRMILGNPNMCNTEIQGYFEYSGINNGSIATLSFLNRIIYQEFDTLSDLNGNDFFIGITGATGAAAMHIEFEIKLTVPLYCNQISEFDSEVCNAKGECVNDDQCLCEDGFTGVTCDACSEGYNGWPNCQICNCSGFGCDEGGCLCGYGFAGDQCDQHCDCNGFNCDNTGVCLCMSPFSGEKCGDSQGEVEANTVIVVENLNVTQGVFLVGIGAQVVVLENVFVTSSINIGKGELIIEGNLTLSTTSSTIIDPTRGSIDVKGCVSFNGALELATDPVPEDYFITYECRSGSFSKITTKDCDITDKIFYDQKGMYILTTFDSLCDDQSPLLVSIFLILSILFV